jgi:hypothetical protein
MGYVQNGVRTIPILNELDTIFECHVKKFRKNQERQGIWLITSIKKRF